MYCSNCGKEIDNNARFCSGCGAGVSQGAQNVPNANVEAITTFVEQKGIKIICLLLMMGTTIFVASGGLFPIVGGIEGFGSSSEGWTLFELLDFVTDIEEYVEVASLIKLILWLAVGCYIISVIACGKAVLSLLAREKNEDITDPVTISMVIGETAFVIIFILKSIINHVTAEELYGMELLTTTTLGWLLLILPLVNLFIFRKGYLGAAYYEDNQRITRDKVCMICKTTYVIGNKCPKCGSRNVE